MKPFRWSFIFFNFSGASATIDSSPLIKPFSNLNPFSYFSSRWLLPVSQPGF